MTDRAKVCPREPTVEMLRVNVVNGLDHEQREVMCNGCLLGEIWRAMYDAAPSAPSDDALVNNLLANALGLDALGFPETAQQMTAAADRIESLTAELAREREHNKRDGNFLDPMGCCKVCDGEIPYGHTEDCYIWKLEKRHRDFIANEYDSALHERDAATARAEAAERAIRVIARDALTLDECKSVARAYAALAEQEKPR